MENQPRVYLDHAATTAMREEVFEAVQDAYKYYYGNPSSIYKEGREAAAQLKKARESVAAAINADPAEIFFTSSGSEADNWALKGAAFARQAKGKHIITTKIEHHAVLHTAQWLERQGFTVTYLDVDEFALVDADQVRRAMREDTILVSIMMANNEVGTIQPVKEIAEICQERKVLFHTDAVQVLGALPIDVKELGADMLSFSAHKLYGPKGVGALYIKRGKKIDNLLHGGAQEMNRRASTENVPQIIGFAEAVKLAVADLPEESRRLSALRDKLIEEIATTIPYAKLNGHPTKRLPNNINFSFEFIEGESMLISLDMAGFSCSSGSACTSASLEPSHVLLAMGLPHEIAHGSLRISLGRENTPEQLKNFVPTLEKAVKRLRDMSPLWDDFMKGKIEKSLIKECCN